ncbi:MAG TPA: DUF1178 family protein [Polaromonas sp.]|jgi:hypothetical protein
MKVLNLQCSLQHSFEGWFASEDDFQAQLARGLIECPLCADKGIQKLPSAPRLNLGGHPTQEAASPNRAQASPPAPSLVSSGDSSAMRRAVAMPDLLAAASPADQAAFLKALRHLVANTEDVGERFADEARRMHYGDAEARSIRGQTSAREAVDLLEEGIDVMPLSLPPGLKETLQ